MKSRISLRFLIYFVFVAFLTTMTVPLSATASGVKNKSSYNTDGVPRSDVIPRDNSDLDDISAKADAILAFAAACQAMECPILDCEAAGFFQDNLDKADDFLKHLIIWLNKANKAHLKHFESLHNQGSITTENLGRATLAQGVHRFLHNMGSMLLDIASVAGTLDDFLKMDPSKIKETDVAEFLDNLDSFYEGVKDLESLVATGVNEGLVIGGVQQVGAVDSSQPNFEFSTPIGDITGGIPAPTGDFNNDKSTISDIKDIAGDMKDAYDAGGKKWKDALKGFKKPNGPGAALGQIAGRYLKTWSADEMKARQKRLQELVNDLTAEDKATNDAYEARRVVLARLSAAEAARSAVQAANAALQACMVKAECPLRSKTKPGNNLPDFIQIGPNGTQIESWGWALQRIKIELDDVSNRLGPPFPSLRDDCEEEEDKNYLMGADFPTVHIKIGSDSPTWCSFRDGNPESPDDDDPRDTPPPEGGGDDPRDAPPPEGGGDDPRDTPRPEGGGDDDDDEDPRDTPRPDGGDDPRDAPGGGGTTTKEKDDDDDPKDVPVTIYVKARASAVSAGSAAQATAGQKIKLFADSTTNVALPSNGGSKPQTDHDQEPIQGTTDSKGNLAMTVPSSAIGAKGAKAGQSFEVSVDTTAQTSLVATPTAVLPAALQQFVTDAISVGGQQYTVLTLPKSKEKSVKSQLDSAGIEYETNYCREKQAAANDPLYKGKGAWKQKYDNQWAIKRVGLTADSKSAWNKLGKNPKPVIVAVIDTGLDWNHLDIDWKNLWRNPKEVPNNGKDDDRNGYVDDVIGWDFYGRHNKPWDHDGHGTIVAGIIAATQNNKIGMAGINPHAKIMVLKALNSFGHSRASYLAKSITYAVDNGARIINMSVGGKEITNIEKAAVKYAISKGVLIIVASGNEGVDVKNYGIAGLDGVLSVSATDLKDKRASFSNWGAQIDIAAPGIDVLSLRARRTDTMRDIPGVEYKNGANYVGKDKRYYRASGTSFSAPIVAGVASLVMSKHPELTGEEVAQILMQTADDVDTPGVDQYSGHGIVNANKALEAEAGMFLSANISGVQVVQGKKGPIVQVMGTAEADQFKKATIHIGAGENPGDWKKVAKVKKVVKGGLLGEIDANELRSSKVWIIRLTVEHKNGKEQEFRFKLSLG